MDTSVIPKPDAIPVNHLWFYILLIVTFALHIILVNLALGGSMLAIWDRFKGRNTSAQTRNLPIMIALAINLGVPPLLFLQVLYGQFFYTSSVLMANYWILVIPILIIAYYGIYVFVKSGEKAPFWAKISLVLSTFFMLFISFMFVDNILLAQNPSEWLALTSQQNGAFLYWKEPSLWPRFLHFLVASIAVAALGKALFINYAKQGTKKIKQERIKKNLRIVFGATLLQFVVGTWFWLSMPSAVGKLFLGGDLLSTIFMLLALLIAFAIIYFSFVGNLKWTIFMGVLEVFIMSFVREFSRSSYLSGIFHPSELQNQNQVSPLYAFLAIFIIGLLFVYYMISLSQKPKNPTS